MTIALGTRQKRVALIAPPFDFAVMNRRDANESKQGGYYIFYPPLGLCGIAAELAGRGYDVTVIDAQAEGLDEAGTVRAVIGANPAIIGISVTTPCLPVVKNIISEIRQRVSLPVIAGGPHVSCDPACIGALGADYGIAGDGERPFAELSDLISANRRLAANPVAGAFDRTGAAAAEPFVADVDTIPIPYRDILRRKNAYFNPFMDTLTTTLVTVRGCPFACTFCCRTYSMGGYRPYGLARVKSEIRQIAAEGYGFVCVVDETFTFDRERATAVADLLASEGKGLKWSCQTRADLVDEELIRHLAKCGCVNISFGVEAGETVARAALDKNIEDDDFTRAFDMCRRAGLTINAFVIIGAPGESREAIESSFRRVVQLEPDYAVFNIGTLFPGSKEYQTRVESGSIDRSVWDAYANGTCDMPRLSDMPDGELYSLLARGYRVFYLRPSYMLKKLLAVRSARDMGVLSRQGLTVIRDYIFRK